jgi:3D (Asp-Asp-Asp) domain-containing protein
MRSVRYHHPLVMLTVALAMLALLTCAGHRDFASEVIVVYGQTSWPIKTKAKTVGEVVSEFPIVLSSFDAVYPSLETEIVSGMEIFVQPSFTVNLQVDGKNYIHHTTETKVIDVLHELEVELGPLDFAVPGLATTLTEDSRVNIIRVEEQYSAKHVLLGYKVIQRIDRDLEKGKTVTVQAGRNGTREDVYKLTYHNGVLVSEELISQEVIEDPVSQVVAVGTKILFYTTDTPAGPIRYRQVLDLEATAYYPGPESTGKWADGITYTGAQAGYGVVAVDPSLIPLGTRLYIPGYGIAVAADIGGAIKGNIVDLCFDTYREAVHFGRRRVKVYVLE